MRMRRIGRAAGSATSRGRARSPHTGVVGARDPEPVGEQGLEVGGGPDRISWAVLIHRLVTLGCERFPGMGRITRVSTSSFRQRLAGIGPGVGLRTRQHLMQKGAATATLPIAVVSPTYLTSEHGSGERLLGLGARHIEQVSGHSVVDQLPQLIHELQPPESAD